MRSGGLLDQHTLDGFPALGFSLFFYVDKYYVRRDDAPPGIYFAIWVPNKLEIIFGSLNCAAIKMHIHGFGSFWDSSSVNYVLCCVIFGM